MFRNRSWSRILLSLALQGQNIPIIKTFYKEVYQLKFQLFGDSQELKCVFRSPKQKLNLKLHLRSKHNSETQTYSLILQLCEQTKKMRHEVHRWDFSKNCGAVRINLLKYLI